MARRHLFVCTNARASGKPACGVRGGAELLLAIQQLLLERGSSDVVVTACGCLGLCFDGPTAVVYPDGVWYGGLGAADAPHIAAHLVDGTAYPDKHCTPPGSASSDEER